MNINENKYIKDHEPTILEELKGGMHEGLVCTYTSEYMVLTADKSHEKSIGILIDRFRRGHNVDHTVATRCVNEMLWKHCGIQTLNTEEDSDGNSR